MPNSFYGFIENDRIILDEKETNHIKIVNKSINDIITIITGDSYIYKSRILDIKKKQTITIIEDKRFVKQFDKPLIDLYIGMSKWDRIKFLIEKAVEMKINNIFIYKADKSNQNYKSIDKFKKVLIESCKQNINPYIPNLNFINFKNIPSYNSLILDFDSNSNLKQKLEEFKQRISLIIGPDMGFSSKEKEYFSNNNYNIVSLGNSIMRFETSAIYIMSIINYENNRL